MKKNTTIMLIILAFIALLHFAFLYIFFMDRDAKQKNPPNPPALIPQPPEPTVAFPEKKNLDSKPAGSKSQPKKKTVTPPAHRSNIPDSKLNELIKEAEIGARKQAQASSSNQEVEVGEGDSETIPLAAVAMPASAVHFDYSKAARGVIKAVPDTKFVKSGILFDPETNRVLWALSPEEQVPIASMTKMMTLLVALEMLNARKDISFGSLITVSKTAPQVSPTRLGLSEGQPITVEELLKSMIIKSANDCAQMVAETFGNGNAANFIAVMNRRAVQLGMKSTRFYNPHGLPGKSARSDNISSCEDMVILSQALMKFPKAREWVGTKNAKVASGFDQPVVVVNHNKLLGSTLCPGINGIKTGFTQRAGFCIAVNCTRTSGRLIAIITGFPSSKGRDAMVAKLINWGFRRQAAIAAAKTH